MIRLCIFFLNEKKKGLTGQLGILGVWRLYAEAFDYNRTCVTGTRFRDNLRSSIYNYRAGNNSREPRVPLINGYMPHITLPRDCHLEARNRERPKGARRIYHCGSAQSVIDKPPNVYPSRVCLRIGFPRVHHGGLHSMSSFGTKLDCSPVKIRPSRDYLHRWLFNIGLRVTPHSSGTGEVKPSPRNEIPPRAEPYLFRYRLINFTWGLPGEISIIIIPMIIFKLFSFPLYI